MIPQRPENILSHLLQVKQPENKFIIKSSRGTGIKRFIMFMYSALSLTLSNALDKSIAQTLTVLALLT